MTRMAAKAYGMVDAVHAARIPAVMGGPPIQLPASSGTSVTSARHYRPQCTVAVDRANQHESNYATKNSCPSSGKTPTQPAASDFTSPGPPEVQPSSQALWDQNAIAQWTSSHVARRSNPMQFSFTLKFFITPSELSKLYFENLRKSAKWRTYSENSVDGPAWR
jgi:hypothetical protein